MSIWDSDEAVHQLADEDIRKGEARDEMFDQLAAQIDHIDASNSVKDTLKIIINLIREST